MDGYTVVLMATMQHFFTFVEVPSSGIGGADTGPSRSQGQESDCDAMRGGGGVLATRDEDS